MIIIIVKLLLCASLLLLITLGCDQKPQNAYDFAIEQQKKAERERSEGLRALSGKKGFICAAIPGTDQDYEAFKTGETFHSRRDCPKLAEELSHRNKVVMNVTFAGEKLVDEKGFFYKGVKCDRCCP